MYFGVRATGQFFGLPLEIFDFFFFCGVFELINKTLDSTILFITRFIIVQNTRSVEMVFLQRGKKKKTSRFRPTDRLVVSGA